MVMTGIQLFCSFFELFARNCELPQWYRTYLRKYGETNSADVLFNIMLNWHKETTLGSDGTSSSSKPMERVLGVQVEIPPDDLRELVGSVRDLLLWRSTSNI